MFYLKGDVLFLAEVPDKSFVSVRFIATKMEIAMQSRDAQPLVLHHESKGNRVGSTTEGDEI
jgi:hypothetical protein